jgi:hypothetical protein
MARGLQHAIESSTRFAMSASAPSFLISPFALLIFQSPVALAWLDNKRCRH